MHIVYILLTGMWLLSSCDRAKLSDARDQYLRGQYYAAGETYRRLYKNASREEKVQRGIIAFEMAENYRMLNQSGRAVTAYSNAIRYGYPDSMMYFHYARMLHREGKYEAAGDAYRQFLAFKPDDPLSINGICGAELAMRWSANPIRCSIQRMDLLNSNRSEFSPVFSPKGDRLYFASSREDALGEEKSPVTGMKYNDFFSSVRNVHGEWQKPERISSGVNTVQDEGTPSFSTDGEWMYYTYSEIDPDRPTTPKIYLSGWVNGKWGEGKLMEIVKGDSLSIFAHPAISPSGNWLYFVSDMPGGYGGKDIWRVQLRNHEGVGTIENLGPDINTAGDEMFPYLCDDYTLYFSSDGHPGMGGLDLFVAVTSERENGGMGDRGRGRDELKGRWIVSNLQSPINSSADDFGITFAPGEEKGFFSSNRNDARGYDHIYSFAYQEVSIRVEGFVVDPEDEFIPEAVVTIVGSDGSQFRLVTDKEGGYHFKAGKGDYLLMAAAEGFLNQKQRLSISAIEKDTIYYIDFEMIPYNKPVVLNNIFYDFDSATLRPESKKELDGLIVLLNENPSVTITLAAHTDRKGSDEYNVDLSLRRAQSVVNYLVSHGIAMPRLTAYGFGKTRPVKVTKRIAGQIDFLNEGDELTEEFIESLMPDQQEIADQINRRTSFEVIDNEFGVH